MRIQKVGKREEEEKRFTISSSISRLDGARGEGPLLGLRADRVLLFHSSDKCTTYWGVVVGSWLAGQPADRSKGKNTAKVDGKTGTSIKTRSIRREGGDHLFRKVGLSRERYLREKKSLALIVGI